MTETLTGKQVLARADLEAENARLLKRCGDLQRDTVLTIRDLEEANAKLLEVLRLCRDDLAQVLETFHSWNNEDDLVWIQYKLPETITTARAALGETKC